MTRGGAGAGAPAGATGEPIELRVTAGRPTDEELAAITAVLHEILREQASIPELPVVRDDRHWQRAHSFLRSPVVPGPGAWRSF